MGRDAAHAALTGSSLEQQWDEYAANGGPAREVECEATSGTTEVDAVVGVAGTYDLFVPIFRDDPAGYGRGYQQAEEPELWAFLTGAIGGNPDLRVRLIHGLDNPYMKPLVSEGFAEALEAAGYDVELELVESSDLDELPDTSVPMIVDLLGQ